MPINFIIIPAVIIATAVVGSRYVKQGSRSWYKELRKPSWTPSGKLIGEIWTFLYALLILAVLWYWNVPVVSWLHYAAGLLLLVNAYLNAIWNRVFFVEQNIPKAIKTMMLLNATGIAAAIVILIDSPIAAMLMLPYIIWVAVATKLTREILDLNKNEKKLV
jgi:translocator protein